MSDIVIQAEGLSKYYRIGGGFQFDSLRSRVVRSKRPAADMHTPAEGDRGVWAVKDVSLEVSEGEVVGIVGRNGSGKSTLLKILTRITAPTEGHATIKGRVGSLLEVGTGFHPELTGRENVFLNGAVLGMKQKEIKHRFDEIVAFSEVEKFIDTPVKHYSSGMYVRLAFAVAAHVEPDILLLDEVLAVGDIGFQDKCLERIRSLTAGGVTTLMVSHSMASIKRLCKRTIWLEEGRVAADDVTSKAMEKYIDSTNKLALNTVGNYLDTASRRGSGEVRFTDVEVMNSDGKAAYQFRRGDDIHIRAKYKSFRELTSPEVGFLIRDVQTGVFVASVRKNGVVPDLSPGSEGAVECVFHSVPLRPRRYSLQLHLADPSYQRLSYDVWDGAGPDIVLTADGDSDFLVGYDTSLVAIPAQVTHSPI